jgi:hypothetical protein
VFGSCWHLITSNNFEEFKAGTAELLTPVDDICCDETRISVFLFSFSESIESFRILIKLA